MESHLTNGQMEELLRFAMADAAVTQDWRAQTDIQAHLNSCSECQSRFQIEEAYLKELLALRNPDHISRREDCPLQEIWIQLAGNCVEKDAEMYLDHAAQCDYCSRLFREAIEDLQGPLGAREQEVLAALERSSGTWPTRARAFFKRVSASERIGPNHPSRTESTILTYLSHHRIALGVVVFVCLVFGVLYRHSLDLAQQVRQSRVQVSRLEEDLQRQSKKIVELSAGSKDGSRLDVAAMRIVTLPLTPGLTRSGGVLARIALPSGTKYVELTLGSVDVRHGSVNAVLTTVDGQQKWSQDFTIPQSEVRERNVSFVIPAYVLPPNDYQVALFQDLPNGKRELAEYSFRVIPTDH